MNNDAVKLKLYKEGMIVSLDGTLLYDELKNLVREKFKKSESFFKDLTLKVGFWGAELEDKQYAELIEIISEVLSCKAVLWENPQPLEQKEEKEKESLELTGEQILDRAFQVVAEDEFTKFYTKTIRSGQLLESVGNIVVVGDVNPGAELIAAGNIVVMGTVKGTVHAGVMGNREAVVAALNLSPTQLRIADVITRSPDEDENHGLVPEIAYINNDSIVIEEILQKRK